MGVACCCSAAVLKTLAISLLYPTVAMSTAVTPFCIMQVTTDIILSGYKPQLVIIDRGRLPAPWFLGNDIPQH